VVKGRSKVTKRAWQANTVRATARKASKRTRAQVEAARAEATHRLARTLAVVAAVEPDVAAHQAVEVALVAPRALAPTRPGSTGANDRQNDQPSELLEAARARPVVADRQHTAAAL
jgi:hypothetical protein